MSDSARCPECDELVQIYYQSPQGEDELHCQHCGSVHIKEGGRKWVYHGSLYPWRSQQLKTCPTGSSAPT